MTPTTGRVLGGILGCPLGALVAGVIGYAVVNATTPPSVEPVLRWSNAIVWAFTFVVLGAIIGSALGAIVGSRIGKRSKPETSNSRTKGRGSILRELAGIVVGPAAAAFSSIPAFFLSYLVAEASLSARLPPLSELVRALPFLATLAAAFGFICMLIARVFPPSRGWYTWVGAAAASAVASAMAWAALVCFVAKRPLADPAAITILIGLTITGAVSGVVSRVIVVNRSPSARP